MCRGRRFCSLRRWSEPNIRRWLLQTDWERSTDPLECHQTLDCSRSRKTLDPAPPPPLGIKPQAPPAPVRLLAHFQKKKTFTQLERLWQPDSSAAGKEKMRSDDKNLHYLVSSWDSIRLCMCECVRMKAWCAHTSASEVRECSLPTGYVKMSHPLCPARWVECRASKVNDNNEKWTTLLLLLLLSIFGPKMFPDYWLIVLKAFPLSGPAPRLSLDVFNGSKIQTPTAASVCGSIKSATRQDKTDKKIKKQKNICAVLSVITQRARSNWVLQYDIRIEKDSICKNQMNNRYTKREQKKKNRQSHRNKSR